MKTLKTKLQIVLSLIALLSVLQPSLAQIPINAGKINYAAPLEQPQFQRSSYLIENVIPITNQTENALLIPKLSYKTIDTVTFIGQFMQFWFNKPFDFNPETGLYSFVATSKDLTTDRNVYIRTSDNFDNWSTRIPIFKAANLNELPTFSSVQTVKKGNDIYGFLGTTVQANNEISIVQSYVNLSNPADSKKYSFASYTNNGNLYDFEYDNCFAAGLTKQNEIFGITISKGIITSAGNKVSTFPVTTLKDMNTFNWETKMPANLTSKWFVESNGVTVSMPIGISQTKDRVYYAMFGQFIDDLNILPNLYNIGFSYTEDYGKTWSEPQKTTKKLFEDFLKSYGVIKDSISIFQAGTHKGFSALDNGNVSFITEITYKNNQNVWNQMMIEVYYENNNWGIRPISSTIGSNYVIYVANQDNQLTPQICPSSNEIQLSKTANNQYFVAKWLEGQYYQGSNSQNIQVYLSRTQIKVALRKVGTTNWTVENLTEGGQNFDRYYFLPSVLPNDLKNIPIFCLKSTFLSTDKTTADSILSSERIDLLNKLCTSKFNLDPETSANSPQLFCTTTAINFDTLSVNNKKEISFAISNTGKGNLILSSIKINNDVSNVFSIKDEKLSDTIAPDKSRNITISFIPKDMRSFTGVLNISSNDKNTPNLTIALSGQGVLPMLWNKNSTFPIINFAHSSKLLKQAVGKQTIAWADDFVVTAGKKWEIDTLGFTVVNEIAAANSYQFTIFGDLNGLPNSKDIKFSYNFIPNWAPPVEQIGNIFADIKNSNLVLNEGKYWISFYGIHNNGRILTTAPGYSEMTYWGCEELATGVRGNSSSAVVDSAGLLIQNIPSPWVIGSYSSDLPIVNMAFYIFGKETDATGINELSLVNGSISAYPNPAKDDITLQIKDGYIHGKIEIYRSNGSWVENVPVIGKEIKLNLKSYLNGSYYFQLKNTSNQTIGSGKFIKISN